MLKLQVDGQASSQTPPELHNAPEFLISFHLGSSIGAFRVLLVQK